MTGENDPDARLVSLVLQQFIDKQWQPLLAYFSKSLKPAEDRYNAFDRDLLGIYPAIKHFHYFLEGRQFYILTDHKPLTYAPAAKPEKYSPRQSRHLHFISQFTADIHHVRGSDNTALSHFPISNVHLCD